VRQLVVHDPRVSLKKAKGLLRASDISFTSIDRQESTVCASRFAVHGVPDAITSDQRDALDTYGALLEGVPIT